MLRKSRNTLVITLALLLLIEIALQVRSHIRFGQSVFNALANETTYQFNEQLGIKLLRPNHTLAGSNAVITTNALGLRDDDLESPKPENQYRIALVGASTVMGTYTRNNADTLSYQLQDILNNSLDKTSRPMRVINAGIAGYSLQDQRKIVDNLLSKLDVDHYILYTGFNDLGGYCKPSQSAAEKDDYSLPTLALPKWLLTTELITKNTVALRTSLAKSQALLNPQDVDKSEFSHNLEALLQSLKRTEKPVLVIGNAVAFRRDMPQEQQANLSETARYYNGCFDTAGLLTLYDAHNDIIRAASEENGMRFFNLQSELPGGEEWFGDSSHFSVKGNKRVAEIIAAKIAPDLPNNKE